MARTNALRRQAMLSFGATALLAVTAATAQVAGTSGNTGIDTSGSYRLEVQACQSGRTQQDRETCLREARNARADKQRGTMDNGANFRANAMARCQPLGGEEKAACEARVMGYGDVSGSVAGGGVLRQVETVVMPPGQTEVTIEPKTSDPVVLVPVQRGEASGAAPALAPAPTLAPAPAPATVPAAPAMDRAAPAPAAPVTVPAR